MHLHRICLVTALFLAAPLFAVSPTHSHPPARLGVALHEIMEDEVKQFGLPGEYGAWVVEVAPDSPAAQAGLQENDVILAYNNQRVESARALQRMVSETPAGRTVELRLIRAGAPMLILVRLGAASDLPAVAAAPAAPAAPPAPAATPRPPRRFGVGVEPVAAAVAEFLGITPGTGLIVRAVQPDSAAARAGVQNRDILVGIGGTEIKSVEDIANFINTMPGDETELSVVRGNERLTLTVKF